ncbi:hypothetical protein EDB86DRAFT_2953833 [Lactarius hatsudake]|nr:hypothetical protein EDB86DRAFT_2953833 [Lactarius hatsudake]
MTWLGAVASWSRRCAGVRWRRARVRFVIMQQDPYVSMLYALLLFRLVPNDCELVRSRCDSSPTSPETPVCVTRCNILSYCTRRLGQITRFRKV